MAHAEDDPSLLHGCFHLDAVFNRGRHGLLAQDVVSLCSEGEGDLHVHLVLDGNNDGVREAGTDRLEGVCGCFEKVLPAIEHERAVDRVRLCEDLLRELAWLCNRDDLAFRRFLNGVGCVCLLEGRRSSARLPHSS